MDATNQLCRLCAQYSLELVEMFSEKGRNRRIIDKIHIHLPVQITAEDCLPTTICEECLNSLEVSHNLLKLCLDADSKLREILKLPEDPSHLAALNELKASIGSSYQPSLPIWEGDTSQLRDNVSSTCIVIETKPDESSSLLNASHNLKVQDSFTCKLCSEKFCSADLLLQHRVEDHGSDKTRVCVICGEYLQDSSYIDHILTHFKDGDETVQECGYCGKIISSVEALKLHICEDCENGSRKPVGSENPSSHPKPEIMCVKEENPLSCLKCSLIFKCKKDLSVHMKSHTFRPCHLKKPSSRGKRGIECRVCGKVFESFWYMTRHRSEDHSKEEVALALRRHGLDREKFECNVCGKLLSCRFTYKHHLQAHEGVRNHQCPHCDRSFVYLAQLKSHVIVHTGGPHACPVCSKQFPNAFALRVHVRTHTGERPFQCELCPKAFHSRANYEQHVVIHTDKRKYLCHLCPYRARRPEALRTHIRVHTNERPYTCKVCGRGFKQKYDCTKHERLHAKRCPKTQIKAGVVISAPQNSKESIHTPEWAADEPNPLSVVPKDKGSNIAISVPTNSHSAVVTSAAETTSIMSICDERTTTQAVQEIFVAFEDASEQCSVYWTTS